MASKAGSAPQKSWLKRIGEQIEKSIVIDRETIDTNEPFAADGGYKRLNKVLIVARPSSWQIQAMDL
jgi:type I restriction enzyme R subunit